jgi:hypothetical protein
VQVQRLAHLPGLHHHLLAAAQPHALAVAQHMVVAIADARDPGRTAIHLQPARLARLQLQHAVQMQFPRDAGQHLQVAVLMQTSHVDSCGSGARRHLAKTFRPARNGFAQC